MGGDAQVKKLIIEWDEKKDRINIDYEGDVMVKEAIFMVSMADHMIKTESYVDDEEDPETKGWLMP
jgi:uncharacterized DUF497 family protein